MATTLMGKVLTRFAALFERRTPIFRKKDRVRWELFKEALEAEGVRDIRAYSYNAELLCANGCGAKLDPRDFGVRGPIDRNVYVIEAREKRREAVLAALARRGLAPEVDENPTMDAAERLREAERKRLKYFSRHPPHE